MHTHIDPSCRIMRQQKGAARERGRENFDEVLKWKKILPWSAAPAMSLDKKKP